MLFLKRYQPSFFVLGGNFQKLFKELDEVIRIMKAALLFSLSQK